MRAVLTALACCALVPATAQAARLQLGLADAPGGAQAMRKEAPFGYRYQYLAGGVNTGRGWATWNPDGTFVTRYIDESVKAHITPVFTYYQIAGSQPGVAEDGDRKAAVVNLRNRATMKAYWADLSLFFRRANATHRRVVLHVEPDMWGFLEGDHADLARAFAQHVVRLRNRFARKVVLGYHLSIWGTGTDIAIQDPDGADVERLAARAAAYYNSLRAHFDLIFGEFSDRDSGFRQHIYGVSHKDAWWDAADFARHVHFLAAVHRRAKVPIVLWQIPLGNTSLPDTWGRFRDNRPQWLLGPGSAAHRKAYERAGVRALLFGGGADGTTNEHSDGGWFLQHARAYYRRR